MKIIFFGSSEFSIPVLKSLLTSKHSVATVITTPDKKRGRGQKLAPSIVKAFAAKERLAVLSPEKLSAPSVLESIKAQASDLIVIASYGKIVPASIFTSPRIASLNVHPSLLPRHRGASPIQNAILEEDEQTGVSIAEVTDKLDSGDVLAQIETQINADENALELSNRLAKMAGKQLLEVMDRIQNGEISKMPQDESKATYAKKLERNSGKIDWEKPAAYIHNQVRAYYPWPSAFTFFRGKRLKIFETRRLKVLLDKNKPGTITDVDSDKFITVQTQAEPLALIRLQLEGKREMNAFEFALGQRIKKGERFGAS